jgi:hypothetical protein
MGLFGGGGTAARHLGMWSWDQAKETEGRVAGLLGQQQEGALSALGQGYAAAAPEYQGAIDRLNPWTQAGQGALGTYTDSLGQNGQAGYDRTVAQYRATPGYERRVSEATDKVLRSQGAMGMLGSGNTQAAVADRVQGLADEDFTRWQSQLNNLSTQGMQAAGQQGQFQQGLGNLYAQQGRDEAGIYTGFAPLMSQNAWNATNLGTGAVLGQSKQASDAVASQTNLGLGLAGTAIGLLGAIPTGGLSLGLAAGGLGKMTAGSGGLY